MVTGYGFLGACIRSCKGAARTHSEYLILQCSVPDWSYLPMPVLVAHVMNSSRSHATPARVPQSWAAAGSVSFDINGCDCSSCVTP